MTVNGKRLQKLLLELCSMHWARSLLLSISKIISYKTLPRKISFCGCANTHPQLFEAMAPHQNFFARKRLLQTSQILNPDILEWRGLIHEN